MVGGGIVPLVVLMALPLDIASLTTCFLEAIVNEEGEFFKKDFEFLGERSWVYGLSSHRKHQFVVEIFHRDRSKSQSAPQMREESGECVNKSNAQCRYGETHDFLSENSNREKITERKRRFHYNSQVTRIIGNSLVCLSVTIDWKRRRTNNPFFCWRKMSTYTELSAWRWMGCWLDLHNCTIDTWWFIVTVVIIDTGLWESHAGNLIAVHNCSRWEVLHFMNMGEKGEA